MNIEIDRTGHSASVSLSGELTIYTVAEVKAGLAEAMNSASEIEVDLAGISEMDSAGLQLMLIAKRSPGKAVCFVNHPASVLRLVDLANLGSLLGDPLFISASKD